MRKTFVPLLLALAACGASPAVHYHTLSVANGSAARLSPRAKTIQIAAVHIPASLDRRQMVSETGPNAVEVSDRDRWSAPLADMVRRVLSEDLQARLPAGSVVMPDMPAPADTGQIAVSLSRFGPAPGGKATLVGSWALVSGTRGNVLIRRSVSFETAVSAPSGDAAAAAMSELLGRLANDIATALAAAG